MSKEEQESSLRCKVREWLWRGVGRGHQFWSFFLFFDLYIDVEKLGVGSGGGWWVHLCYSVISDPFLTMNFKFDQDHGQRPGSKLDKIAYIYIALFICNTFCWNSSCVQYNFSNQSTQLNNNILYIFRCCRAHILSIFPGISTISI